MLAGFLLWLACPPLGLWPLAWIAVAPLIVSVTRAKSWRQAAWRGYLFGGAYIGLVCYWAKNPLSGFSKNSLIGIGAWLILTLILSAFYALWGGVSWGLLRRGLGGWRIVAPAAAWVVMEWLRGLGSISMPWMQLSYTQYHFLPIIQFAEFTGAFGVSFVLMLFNGAVAYWWLERGHTRSVRPLWAAGTLAVMLCLYGAARLVQPETGRPITVAAMQIGISSFNVPPPEQQFPIFTELTRKALREGPTPSLYVWAESAAPDDVLHDQDSYDFMRRLAEETQAGLLTGTAVRSEKDHDFANASVLFLPDGRRPLRYDKQQLVPFGEFIPFRGLISPLLGDAVELPEDIYPGRHSHLMRYTDPHVGKVALGLFICYEALFPDYARRMTREGADLLVTQSNDSWFQSRPAMEQHLAAVTLRAVENRRDVVRSTTTGVTCLLDAEGRELTRASLYRADYRIGTLHLQQRRTLYTLLGDWFVLFCALLAAIAMRRAWLRRRGSEE